MHTVELIFMYPNEVNFVHKINHSHKMFLLLDKGHRFCFPSIGSDFALPEPKTLLLALVLCCGTKWTGFNLPTTLQKKWNKKQLLRVRGSSQRLEKLARVRLESLI
jgi:hypothetical protein